MPEAMTIGDTIEDPSDYQAIALYFVVYGNSQHSHNDLRFAFYQQEPSIIEGWKRLAKAINSVTTPQTLENIMKGWR